MAIYQPQAPLGQTRIIISGYSQSGSSSTLLQIEFELEVLVFFCGGRGKCCHHCAILAPNYEENYTRGICSLFYTCTWLFFLSIYVLGSTQSHISVFINQRKHGFICFLTL